MTRQSGLEDHLRSFTVPKQRRFVFDVNGFTYDKLDDAQWHAYCESVRHKQPPPRIYCRLARQAQEVKHG